MLRRKGIMFFAELMAGIFFCGTAISQTLSLQDAISIALKNNLDIEVLRNNMEISSINNYIGVAGGLPVVTGSVSDNEQVSNVKQKLYTGTIIKRSGTAGNTLNSGVTASLLLYNGSRVVSTKRRLAELEVQSQQYINSEIQNVAAAVMSAYYDVVRQEGYIKTIDTSIAASQKRLEIVKAQQNVGMANNADLFQSQLDLNSLIQSKQSQQLIIEQSKTELLLLLNLKPDSVILINDTILVDKSIVLGDILSGLTNNADIAAANEEIKINELISKETAALRYPSLRLSSSYNYNRSQIAAGNVLLNQSNGVNGGISLSIPIYNGTIYKRQQKVADINTKNAALQKEILMRNYTASVIKIYQAYAANLQQLETQQKNVILADQLLSLVMQRFQLRQATILEVKQAQQSFENASYTLTNLAFAAKSSEIELKRLANQIKF